MSRPRRARSRQCPARGPRSHRGRAPSALPAMSRPRRARSRQCPARGPRSHRGRAPRRSLASAPAVPAAGGRSRRSAGRDIRRIARPGDSRRPDRGRAGAGLAQADRLSRRPAARHGAGEARERRSELLCRERGRQSESGSASRATCDLRPATCDLRPATCDLRPATCPTCPTCPTCASVVGRASPGPRAARRVARRSLGA